MTTVIYRHHETDVPRASAEGDALWLPQPALAELTGWELKPKGLCREAVCVPVPANAADQYVRGDAVNVAAFWQRLGRPVRHAADGTVWVLGDAAADRSQELQNLEAPDFVLPDLAGNPHALSEHRGKKVLLWTWASW
jgi:hypothetical protein